MSSEWRPFILPGLPGGPSWKIAQHRPPATVGPGKATLTKAKLRRAAKALSRAGNLRLIAGGLS